MFCTQILSIKHSFYIRTQLLPLVMISPLHNKQDIVHIDVVREKILDLKTWNIGFYISVSRHTLKLRLTLWGKSASYICNHTIICHRDCPCCPFRGGLSRRLMHPFSCCPPLKIKFVRDGSAENVKSTLHGL